MSAAAEILSLAAITHDVAGVRRMLVETGWLERGRAGSTYGPGRPPARPGPVHRSLTCSAAPTTGSA